MCVLAGNLHSIEVMKLLCASLCPPTMFLMYYSTVNSSKSFKNHVGLFFFFYKKCLCVCVCVCVRGAQARYP